MQKMSFLTLGVVDGRLQRQLLVLEPARMGTACGGIGLLEQLVPLLRPPAEPHVDIKVGVEEEDGWRE